MNDKYRVLRRGAPEEAGISAHRVDNLSKLCNEWIADGTHGAIVTTVARKGIIVHEGCFGSMGPESDAAQVSADALFPLVCGTKPLTSIILMQLVDEGRVSLLRPVQEIIPEFVGAGKDKVILKNCLAHSAGMREADIQKTADAAIARGSDPSTWTPDDYFKFGLTTDLGYEPGTAVEYHHFGFELAKTVIERVTNRPLQDVAQERVLGPLGMRDTYYSVPKSERHRIVRRPDDAPGQTYDERYPAIFNVTHALKHENHDVVLGYGGAYSTARDYAVLLQMMLQGGRYGDAQILSPAAVREMTTNQNEGLVLASWAGGDVYGGWGLGFDIPGDRVDRQYSALCSASRFCHSGWGGVQFWADPYYDLVATFFSTELRNHPTTDVHDWGADLFEGAVTGAIVDL